MDHFKTLIAKFMKAVKLSKKSVDGILYHLESSCIVQVILRSEIPLICGSAISDLFVILLLKSSSDGLHLSNF